MRSPAARDRSPAGVPGRLALSLILAFLGVAIAGVATADAKPRKPPAPLLLEATRGEDPGIFDSRGREVLLRGINVNQLGDYYQANPDFPTVIPLREGDFRRIARMGFNSVRLIVNWSALEPEPGAFDSGYVDRIREAVGWASERGLYTILDMHQDAWGKHIDTPIGESCPPGTNPAVGWDGAPEWATFTDGGSTCHLGLRELSPAVGNAWQAFYDNREQIQDHLIAVWAKLAAEFAADPSIAGYDLINEPNPGLAPGVNDTIGLGDFYDRATDAIRAAEASVPGGREHIIFFEPGVAWSATQNYPVPPPTFTDEDNLVFSPHLYAESIAPTSIEDAFEFAEQAGDNYGVTVWSGEWGYFSGDAADDDDKVTRYGEAEDRHLFGGAWWDWKQACGDPHVIHEPGGQPDALSPSLNRVVCPSGEISPAPKTYRNMLSRPTVRAAPGKLTSLSSSGKTLELEASGVAEARQCGLRIFIPSRAGRPELTGTNIEVRKPQRILGDWIARACVEGEWSVSHSPARERPAPTR